VAYVGYYKLKPGGFQRSIKEAALIQTTQARGADGLKIVRDAPLRRDLIAERGVDSQMLLASEALFLKREVIGPKAEAVRHYHATASIIVMLEGRVRVNYGSEFEHVEYASAGEFILIPALMPHQPVNEDDTEPIVCLVVRNAPWDDVILYNDEG
jgi:uncharacterized RmlC-like cupin family protein